MIVNPGLTIACLTVDHERLKDARPVGTFLDDRAFRRTHSPKPYPLAPTMGEVSNEIEYDDGRAVLDSFGVTLRRYYFPTGQSKQIPYRAIHAAEVRPNGWLTGKGRAWGTAHPRYWLPLDISWPRKDKLVVLDLGGFVHPAFSPDEPDRVIAILRQHLGIPV